MIPSLVMDYWRKLGLRGVVAEYQFDVSRRWRFDYAWPKARVAVEVQGGIFTGGRHVRGAALLKEWEKLNAAAVAGWRVLYCQPCDVMKPEFARAVKRAIAN